MNKTALIVFSLVILAALAACAPATPTPAPPPQPVWGSVGSAKFPASYRTVGKDPTVLNALAVLVWGPYVVQWGSFQFGQPAQGVLLVNTLNEGEWWGHKFTLTKGARVSTSIEQAEFLAFSYTEIGDIIVEVDRASFPNAPFVVYENAKGYDYLNLVADGIAPCPEYLKNWGNFVPAVRCRYDKGGKYTPK